MSISYFNIKSKKDSRHELCLCCDYNCLSSFVDFPDGSVVKNPPARQETWVLSLAREDPLEEGMATHSSILAWTILWPEEPGGLQSLGLHKVRHN